MKKIFLFTFFILLFSFNDSSFINAEEINVEIELKSEYLIENTIVRTYETSTGDKFSYNINLPKELKTDLNLNDLMNFKKVLTLHYLENDMNDELHILETGYNPNFNSETTMSLEFYNKIVEHNKNARDYAERIIKEREKEEAKSNIQVKEKDENSVDINELVQENKKPVTIDGNKGGNDEIELIQNNDNLNENLILDNYESNDKKENDNSNWNIFFVIIGVLVLLCGVILIWKRKWFFN